MIEKYLTSDEMKRLVSTLVAVIGCLIIGALFGILVVPGLRNANKPAAPTGISPVAGETGWLDPAEFPAQKGRLIPPVDPKSLMEASEELIARGKALYEQNCGTCHGEGGLGDGPAAGTTDPEPRDFSTAEGWVNGPDLPGIYRTLEQGIPGSSMTAFDFLTKKDRMALAHYVRHLRDRQEPSGSPEAMQALSEELAVPGERTKNRIGVSRAMAKLEQEYNPPDPLLIPENDRSRGAEILRGAISDASRAAQVLNDSVLWRGGAEDLARSILPSAPGNGFSAAVAVMEPEEWRTLYDELMKRMPVD